MRVTLNLATRPFADMGPAIKRLRIAMTVLAVVAIGLGLGLHAFHRKAEEARARERALDAKIAAVAQERKGYEELMRQPANAQLLTQIATLNQLFDEKTFSWTLAMEDLETVLPGGVQVTSLEPVRDTRGKITLHLRVVGPRDLSIELVRNLERSRHFLAPRIVGENSEASGGASQRLEPVSASNRFDFDLLADYNPSSSRESRPINLQSTEKSEKAENPTAIYRPIRPAQPAPYPLPGFRSGQSRPPYTPSPQPMNDRFHPKPAPGGPQ